ncbi:hypothetical protein QWY85_18055 [Neolewinella lacunae]|uniref:Uncharacterized protein n=1 Tax=Neolewinella lacunae TaxID=1517758 RepID=A0A923PKI1_9BACT|nr:hypothetical protein [Neolewinella lacunae]MBC6995730.1 hypothetical protein [Neolewinella lacunae]MDN3636577.1 hypothetical protein [Neolewinella lacunae]
MDPIKEALGKIVDALEQEGLDYMIVGGFATSYHNRSRTTNDIDVVVQIYASGIRNFVSHFPEWADQVEMFESLFTSVGMFNLTDWSTGIRFDIMAYNDSDYNWAAFQRRQKQAFLDKEVYFCAIEDLIIGKLKWYDVSKSEKQLGDLHYLVKAPDINWNYLNDWIARLNINTHEYWEKMENVTEAAAAQQVKIYSSFPGSKRIALAASFFNFGVLGTRDWIKKNNPSFSELEVTREFVRMSYEAGEIQEWHWRHFESIIAVKIRQDWATRFRHMMKAKNMDYERVAQLAGFKNGAVVKATVARGLPHFARLMVVLWEEENQIANS